MGAELGKAPSLSIRNFSGRSRMAMHQTVPGIAKAHSPKHRRGKEFFSKQIGQKHPEVKRGRKRDGGKHH